MNERTLVTHSCDNCRQGKTGICLNVNPARPGAAYGYGIALGPTDWQWTWAGGLAGRRTTSWCRTVRAPCGAHAAADFNLLKFPDRSQAIKKIADLTLLSDIFPTGACGAHARVCSPLSCTPLYCNRVCFPQ